MTAREPGARLVLTGLVVLFDLVLMRNRPREDPA